MNNAAEQHPKRSIEKIDTEQLEQTFRTNVFSFFLLYDEDDAPTLHSGSVVINSSSVTAYRGSPHLLNYAATREAISAFAQSLSTALVEKGIRVNAVAPGLIWTPLIPSTFPAEHVEQFGGKVPMKRAGQPEEIAESYIFLASDDSSYMTGQVLHPNGGEIIDG